MQQVVELGVSLGAHTHGVVTAQGLRLAEVVRAAAAVKHAEVRHRDALCSTPVRSPARLGLGGRRGTRCAAPRPVAGLTLVHTTPTRYRQDPSAFHRRVLAAVAERGRKGLGDPPGLHLVPRGPLLS